MCGINVIYDNVSEELRQIYQKDIKDENRKLVNFRKFCDTMELIKDNKIIIIGDLDFDGFSCIYNLYDCFTDLGYDFDIHIGTRKDGYGLTTVVLDKYRELGFNVVITADFGIQQKNEFDYAYKIGYEYAICIDHHTVIPDMVPNIDCVINPRLNSIDYGYFTLSAGGVCYLLMRDYYEHIGVEYDCDKNLLRMASMSCIADMVELKNNVWSLVKSGLDILEDTKDKRLKKLLQKALQYKDKLTETDISFSVAPTIGSVSRLSNPYELTVPFIKGDIKKFDTMTSLNVRRKEIQKEVLEKAVMHISNKPLNDVIFHIAEDVPDGMCGIVSSGISQHFKRPSIVLNDRGKHYGGSARSFGNFNLLEYMNVDKEVIKKASGHKMAMGVQLEKDKLSQVHKSDKMNDYLDLNRQHMDVVETYYHLYFEDIPIMYEALKEYSPFGVGNKQPKFITQNVKLDTFFKQGELTIIKFSNPVGEWGDYLDEPAVCIQALCFLPLYPQYDAYYDVYYYIDSEEKIIIEKMEEV